MKPRSSVVRVVGLIMAALVVYVKCEQLARPEGQVSPPQDPSLESSTVLPLYDADPHHLWNRLFSKLYIRPRVIAETGEQPASLRSEGGDVIEFLGWGNTDYWSSQELFNSLDPLLDEFLNGEGAGLISHPLKQAVLQHDLWAAYDHLIHQNIQRRGDFATRQRRDVLCRKLARCIEQLALPAEDLHALPDTYALAVASGAFTPDHQFDAERDYLPSGLLTEPDDWVEIDFHQPTVSHDISERFVTLHTRSLQGRSYYRIFYRFPGGRQELLAYLRDLEDLGVDWKAAAHLGNILPLKNAPAIPVGTEVVLLQLMMSLDDQLRPTPTRLVESFQFRVFANLDGSSQPPTNTGVGINILDYRMKRRRLFNGLEAGGLEREPEGEPQYRVAIDGLRAPDWGFADKQVLFQQCVDCHMGRNLERLGVRSIPSIVHSGGFDAGAQMGVVHPLASSDHHLPATRVVRWKTIDETYRRLLEHLGR